FVCRGARRASHPFPTRRSSALDAAAILLRGWEGSSRSAYQLTTAQRLLGLGFDVLRLNLRDHGDSHHLNRELFNSTRSPEVAGRSEEHTSELQSRDNHVCRLLL